jgi:hypothetical protein
MKGLLTKAYRKGLIRRPVPEGALGHEIGGSTPGGTQSRREARRCSPPDNVLASVKKWAARDSNPGPADRQEQPRSVRLDARYLHVKIRDGSQASCKQALVHAHGCHGTPG